MFFICKEEELLARWLESHSDLRLIFVAVVAICGLYVAYRFHRIMQQEV